MKYFIYLVVWLVKLLFPVYWLLPTRLIYAQARLETGNFTSDIYKEGYNLFGMKLPKVRPTTATGENRGHAVFPSVWHSVYDYFLRQRNFKIDTANWKAYIIETVKSGYAEDKKYAEKWEQLYKEKPVWIIVLAVLVSLSLFVVLLRILKRWLGIDLFEKVRSIIKK